MIVLVDNKSDFVLKRQVTQEEIEMFVKTNKIAYDETSVLVMRKYIGKSLGIKESKPKRINFQLGIGHKVIFIKQQW